MEEKTTIVIDVQLDQNDVAAKLAQVNREMAALRAENAAMKKSVKDGAASWEDVSQALATNEARLKQLKAQQSALSSQVVQAKNKTLEYGSSLKEQSALLSELRNRYQSLTKEERESAQGQDLLKHIQDLDAAVKAADYSQGQFQRNVGNYPAAVQPLQEELSKLTQQLEELRAENKQDTDEFTAVEQRIDEVNQSIAQLTGTVEGMANEGKALRQQLRDMTEELIQMRMRGEENTEQYRQLLEQVGRLKDTMIDAQNEIKQMASDTSTLNAVLDGAKAAAGGFSVAMGIMTLVGDKDSETAKELAEAQTKLQAAIAITTGLQAVQNALQKESALMMGVARLRILAAAAAQKVYAAATRDAEAAQAVFNKVAKSNVYVWLASIILSVAGAIYAFTRGSKEQDEEIKKVNIDLMNQVDVLNRLRSGYEKLNKRVEDNISAAIEQAKTSGDSLEKVRGLEDALYESKMKRMEAEKKDIQYQLDNVGKYDAKYDDTMTKIRQLDEQYMIALRQGDKEKAEFYMNEINALNDTAKAIEKRLDAVNDFNARWNEIMLERQRQLAEREKEDADAAKAEEERRKQANEEAKRRHEERLARIRTEREETTAAVDELIGNIKTLDEIQENQQAKNEAYAASVMKALEPLREDLSEIPKLDFSQYLEGADDLATTLGNAPSALDQFSAAYQANAQEIMETSAALESSFSSVASMYQQMAKDESKSEEERAKAAKRAKAWSKIQIATNAGAAVAKGVATAVDVGFPAAIPAIATMTATILSAIAQAKSLLSEAFESGGVIGGYRGASMGADNTAVIARRGEMVLNANQQKQLFEIANGGSKAGGMYSALADALRSMPAPVLVYSEFKDFTGRVVTLDEAAKLQ